MRQLKANWPVIFRALLYFAIAFLVPFADQIVEFLKKDTWPSGPRLVLASILGVIAGLTALRAFYDGSAQRHADANSPKVTITTST